MIVCTFYVIKFFSSNYNRYVKQHAFEMPLDLNKYDEKINILFCWTIMHGACDYIK